MSKQQKKPLQQEPAKGAPAKSKPAGGGNTPTSSGLGIGKKGFWSNHKLQMIIILISGMMLYVNAIPNDYAMDDIMTITSNKFTKRGVNGWGGLLKYDTFYGFFDAEKSIVAGGRYRPLTPMMFALEAQLFAPQRVDAKGMPAKDKDGQEHLFLEPKHKRDADPQWKEMQKAGQGYIIPHVSHAVNVILYGILCMSIYLLLLTLLNPHRKEENIRGTFIAFTASMLFAFHPLHTEAVANIKGRDEIVTMLGSILAAYWLLKAWYDEGKAKRYITFACIAYFLALLSKETAVTFLGVIPLCFWFFTNATVGQVVKRTLPVFLVFLAFFAIRQSVLGGLGSLSIETDELMNNPFLVLNPNTTAAPLLESATYEDVTVKARLGLAPDAPGLVSETMRISNPSRDTYMDMDGSQKISMIIYTWGYYLRLLFVPHPLKSNYYPLNPFPTGDDLPWGVIRNPVLTISSPGVVVSLLLTLGLLGLGFMGIAKRKQYAFGILYFYGTFSIVSNLIFPIGANMSERFLFMPSLGFCFLIGMFLYWLADRAGKGLAEFKPTIPLAGLAVVLALFAFKTVSRNVDWFEDYRLFMKDVQVSMNDAKLLNAAGGSHSDFANEELARDNERFAKLPPAVQKDSVYEAKKRYYARIRTSLGYLERALKIHPGYSGAWLLYANAHYYLAKECDDLLPRMGNDPAAVQKLLRETLYHYYMAMAAYKEVEVYRPDHEDIKQNRGVVQRDLGKFYGERLGLVSYAIDVLQKSLEINTDDSESLRLLGTALGFMANQTGDLDYHRRAIVAFEKSLSIRPDDPGTLENLSIACNAVGDLGKAESLLLKTMETYEKALNERRNPDTFQAYMRTLTLLETTYQRMGNAAKVAEVQQKRIAATAAQQAAQQPQ